MRGEEKLDTPDSVSEHAKLTVIVTLFQPFALGGEDLDPVIVGEVLSILIPPTVTEAELPALSRQDPVADSPCPSAESTWGLEDESTPESASLHVKLTATLTLFHPLVFGEGDALPVMIGRVRSMLTLPTVADEEFPARSRQLPMTDCPAPSPSVLGGEELDTPERPSEQTKLTVTVTLFQPFALSGEDLDPVIVGEVLSILIPPTVTEAELPALSTHVAVLL